jgi:dipeptidyl-peptidase-4
MDRSKRSFGRACALAASAAVAALAPLHAAAPEARPDFVAAERFTYDKLAAMVPNADIATHWLPGQDRFWYRRSDRTGATAFVLVDAATGRSKPAFDHAALAQALARSLGRPISAGHLPFEDFHYAADGRALTLAVGSQRLRCEVAAARCVAERSTAGESRSPDGRWIAFVRDYNLWVRPATGGEAFALTTDGVRDHGYAGTSGDTTASVSVLRSGVPAAPQVIWSPDSRRILTQWIDEREVGLFHLLESVPADGSLRPKLYSYRYPLPGDKAVATARIVAFDLVSRKRTEVAGEPLVAAYWNPIAGGQVWWSQDGRQIYYLNRDRFYRHVGLNVADPDSGATRRLLAEQGDTNLTINWFREKALARTLANGDFLWFSERSGWAHLYYYRKDGSLRNAVTSGDWLVRNVLAIDEKAQRLFFSGLARDPARQPYDQYVYSVRFDGSDLRLLTPEDADHIEMEPSVSVRSNRSVASDPDLIPERATFSASGRYFVDSFSRPDLPPRLALRRADGSLVRLLETADAAAFAATRVPMPEPFSTLAADGKTRLYGTMFKPTASIRRNIMPWSNSIIPARSR